MTTLSWQMSTYCEAGSSCVGIAASGAIHLRESDDPHVIVTARAEGLGTLISHIKSGRLNRPT
ncbi:DUF397 domain-containing protein [Streptomyces sp. NPDC049577]|uniref:DUF397 domain-containing protein n=1 Tax=Streptomyces sp. NPDC049577 TaxID=3155153 RepID=UPI003445E212